MRAVLSFILALTVVGAPARAGPVIGGSDTIISGEPPELTITGLSPADVVRVHALRTFSKWEQERGRWVEKPVVMHAWADYRSDKVGVIDVARSAPLRGTYAGRDPLGLLWSGYRKGSSQLAGITRAGLYDAPGRPGLIYVKVVRGTEIVAAKELRSAEPSGLRFISVAEQGLNGVFAAPETAKKLPALILLHGSEGGGAEEARSQAARFAAKGYAALAVNYFAWDLKQLKGVPNVHVNHPIETLQRARDWLSARPEADVERLGIYGHSKGAEFAEVAAVRYPWIDAVAACVPTDVVWEGYGIGDERNRSTIAKPEQVSSWSFDSVPLAYVPLRPFVFGEPSPYVDNTERYERSRADHPEAAAAAAIPIEKAQASFLLLGGGRDEVWASGAMAKRLAARMKAAGRSRDVEAHVYDEAGHQICGDGTFPPRVYDEDSTDDRRKDLNAEGAASGQAWNLIQAFFNRRLRQHPQ